MKTTTIIKVFSLTMLLTMSTALVAQNNLTITMKINFDGWNSSTPNKWYDQITFSDDGDYDQDDTTQTPNPDNGKKGRNFKSKVKRNQKLIWRTDHEKKPENAEIILISVTRNPGNGGDYLLSEFWYDSKDNGKTIEGSVRKKGYPEGAEERYIVSFAIQYKDANNDVTYDIYTVDPILRGSDN